MYAGACANEPVHGSALCQEHCNDAEIQGIPTDLKEYVAYSSKHTVQSTVDQAQSQTLNCQGVCSYK